MTGHTDTVFWVRYWLGDQSIPEPALPWFTRGERAEVFGTEREARSVAKRYTRARATDDGRRVTRVLVQRVSMVVLSDTGGDLH